MQIYLPIAEISLNVWVLLAMGGAVGFLSGLLGVGGGFLVTPLLIFMGVPSAVAVATGANQVVASSVSGTLAQWRRNNIDFKLGAFMLAGGAIGSIVGVQLVKLLRYTGQVDLVIALSYVTFLGIVGALMLVESVGAIWRTQTGKPSAARHPGQHSWIHRLPLKQRFHRSKLYISAVPPVSLGIFIGLLSAIMGVGGGFIMVPAMIYLLRVPTNIVFGTSLFQTMFVAAFTTLLHALENQSVDAVLAFLLVVGGVIGAQIGVRTARHVPGEMLRAGLAIIVLIVAVRLMITLVVTPDEPFSLVVGT